VAIIIYSLLKTFVALIINAIVGIIILFLLNLFHVMGLSGAPDLPIDWITVLISAIGGFVGVIIVVYSSPWRGLCSGLVFSLFLKNGFIQWSCRTS
jgi:hypothetical protein